VKENENSGVIVSNFTKINAITFSNYSIFSHFVFLCYLWLSFFNHFYSLLLWTMVEPAGVQMW